MQPALAWRPRRDVEPIDRVVHDRSIGAKERGPGVVLGGTAW